MPAQVSALREEVRNEHRAWPFQLDCRRDIAAIELSGVVYRVRPMRWREKCNLARYSRVGESFLQRQLIKVSLTDNLPLPEAQDEFDALLALTRWINAPGEPQPELPLNSTVLADAAMTVARQLGVRPSQLAHEKAEFVEQLWTLSRASIGEVPAPAQRVNQLDTAAPIGSAAGGQIHLTPALPDPGDMNRIRILPDPAPGVNADSARTDQGLADHERAGKVPTPAKQSGSEPSPELTPRQAVQRNSQNDVSSRAVRQTARFRVRLADERSATVPSATPQPQPPLPRVSSELQGTSRLQESAWSGAPAVTRSAGRQNQTASIPAGAHAPSGIAGLAEPAAATPQRDSTWLHQATSSALEPGTRADTAEPAIADRDELFEEFADRLEQAAEQMGIDL